MGRGRLTTNGVLVLNPDGSFSYTPRANFVGTDLFTYQISDGQLQSNVARVSFVVQNVNDVATGLPTLGGVAQEGQALTADISAIKDADGVSGFSYQWLRDGLVVAAATGSSYAVGTADVGSRISVAVSYTDTLGTNEGPLISNETEAVIPLLQAWADLAYEDFENGFGTYSDGGADALLYTAGYRSHQGSNSVNLQDNSGIASSITLTRGLDLDTPGYTKLKIQFWFQAVSFESNEDFWLQYFDGTTWQTIRTWTVGVDFQKNQFNFASVEISELDYVFPSNAKIRIMSDASGNGDDVYLDEIRICAR